MKRIWTDELILFLIEKVEAAEFIWNHRNPTNKNKLKKQIFWTSLVDELNACFESNVPFEYSEVIRKWNNLKSYFTSETQKVIKAQKSGASAEVIEAISSSWKFQNKMNFMSSTLISTPSVNNFNKRSLHLQGTNNIQTDFSESAQQPALTPTPSLLQCPSQLTVKTDYDPLMEFPSPPTVSTDYDPLMEFKESKPAMSPPQLSPSLLSPHASKQLPQALAMSSPDLSSPVLTPQSEEHSCNPVYAKKRQRETRQTDSPTATLIKSLNELSEALTKRIKSASEDSNDKTVFGSCIASELSKLDEDLQLQGKRRIFNIIWDLQAEQLERKANG